jgi:uncharacterized protein YjbI with pentapeptide repeats
MSHATLRHATLSHAALSHAALSHATMSHATLSQPPTVTHVWLKRDVTCVARGWLGDEGVAFMLRRGLGSKGVERSAFTSAFTFAFINAQIHVYISEYKRLYGPFT